MVTAKKILITIKHNFLLILFFHKLCNFKLVLFTNYNDVCFEYRKCKTMMVKDLKEFIFEKNYKRISFTKIDTYYLLKKKFKKKI